MASSTVCFELFFSSVSLPQAIDEYREVERELCLVLAVAELSGYAEDIVAYSPAAFVAGRGVP